MPRPEQLDPRIPRDRPFRVADAVRHGVPRHRLRSARLATPFRGVRSVEPPQDLAATCRALAARLGPGVAFSHTTALDLLGIERPWTLEDDDALHVVTTRQQDRPRYDGVVAHRSRQASLEVVEHGGLLVTTAAQTFVHVGVGLRRPDDVVVLGDAMMRRRRSFTTVAGLTDLSRRTRKVKGIAQVRAQIPRMRPGTDSSPETVTRLGLVAGGLPCPQVNQVVTDPEGRYVKRVDLVYRAERVAIEYDGDQHRTDRAQWREDVRARRRLEELGWIVIVVVGDDLRDLGRVVARVGVALSRR
ncbi:DUF559 domain-containing protein [Isoptericola aurantiacus]|uniref:DUF559 domain-containing protein n=1 Tax=Isoptericola aurantiacus TaxID=3377839 RepID=UPI00383AA1A5